MGQVNSLSTKDLYNFRKMIEQGDIAGVYAALYANGHRYAKLAEGVLLENTMAGQIALEFMKN